MRCSSSKEHEEGRLFKPDQIRIPGHLCQDRPPPHSLHTTNYTGKRGVEPDSLGSRQPVELHARIIPRVSA